MSEAADQPEGDAVAGADNVSKVVSHFEEQILSGALAPGDLLPSERAIASEMESSGKSLSPKTKWRLAQKAFATTAAYDSAIASTLEQIGARGP